MYHCLYAAHVIHCSESKEQNRCTAFYHRSPRSLFYSQACHPPWPMTRPRFLKRHCISCHGSTKQEAGVRFDLLDGYQAEQRTLWVSVHEKLTSGAMPPKSRPRPGAEEQQQILQWIETQSANETVAVRRLNRRELSAALQDITGLSVDYTQALPGDATLASFDTGADALQDTADSVAQTMIITRRAVDAIRFREPPACEPLMADLKLSQDARKEFDRWKNERDVQVNGFRQARPGEGLLIEPNWVGDRGGMTLSIPPPKDGTGVLRLKLVISVMKPFAEVPNPHFLGRGCRSGHRLSGSDRVTRRPTGTHLRRATRQPARGQTRH